MAHIAGLGCALPNRVVTNAELSAELGVTEDWIVSATGIRERRHAAPEETPGVLAHRAAVSALERAGLAPSALGAIVVGTGSSPRQFPGVSADLQKLLDAPGVPAFDVPLASVGGLFALALAESLASSWGPVLVAGAEVMSAVMARPPRVKETAILFGDGAAAAVVLPGDGPLTIRAIRVGSDARLSDDLSLSHGEPLSMNGRTVILQANRKLQTAVTEMLAHTGVSKEDVSLYVFHQANLNLLKQVGRALGIPEGKVFVNLDRYGNTSSASLLIALAEAFEAGLLPAGSRTVLSAFGAGFGWGAALLEARA